MSISRGTARIGQGRRGAIEKRFVWWLWQTRRFDASAALAAGYDIVFPGWYNTAAGPDFRDAIIADSGGNLLRGDVEVHVVDSSWRDHGHQNDPGYDGVILHVVLDRDSRSPTCTHGGTLVPVLALRPILSDSEPRLLEALGAWHPQTVRCPIHIEDPHELARAWRRPGQNDFRERYSVWPAM